MTLSPNAMTVLEKRYLKKTEGRVETPEDLFRRVAANISQAELNYAADPATCTHWEETFCEVMTRLEFMPNSPTLMNAGTSLQQLSACFVLPVADSMDGIFDSVKHAALIHKSGGGTGFSFSRLRPKDDEVRSTHGVSSGPISFMTVFDAATEAVKQGGRRRGANMAILRVDHPDILDFISAKQHQGRLNNFNISVAITDDFMTALANDDEYDLVNPRTGDSVHRLAAKEVFDGIVRAAWQNGEPGIVFIDRMNEDNPTPAIGAIESTNPCGEQPLLPYESCNLGSINLATMIRENGGKPEIDYERLGFVTRVGVRFLDNVIDMNRYPLPEIEELTKANRKIGLGVMGFADALIRMEIPYDSNEAAELGGALMAFIQHQAVQASEELAIERGPFPNFAGSTFDLAGMPRRRNATTTTVAPTGTISIIAGVSSGIEPIFAVAYVRHVLDNEELVEVNPMFEQIARREGFYSEELMREIAESGGVTHVEAVPECWREVFRTAHDISPEAHVRMQAAFQKHTENAVSKTVNFPKEATTSDVEQVYRLAFDSGCKGVTVYRDGSREGQVLNIAKVNHAAPGNGNGAGNGSGTAEPAARNSRVPRKRSDVLTGTTRKMPTGCGSLYVTINEDARGPFELFAQMGKAGGCAASQAEAIGRLVSLALRAGVEGGAVVKQLRGVRCPSPSWDQGSLVLSCSDAISKALEGYLKERQPADASDNEFALENDSIVNRCVGLCVDCGTPLEFDGGCSVCRSCGFSRCG